ncbi:MAG TPA: DUF6449 domain-containing protein [Syntrophomonadaceae bacterium]|nr:DUF6449 domain-containing protein [Syntrophomonadaceae bacterium]
MKSKTSLVNRGILLNDLKRFWFISAGYLLGLLLTLPMSILMSFSRAQSSGNPIDVTYYVGLFQFSSPLQLILLILVPILTGMWLFHYLQNGKAADMAHVLPIRRETIYNTHILAGFIFLFIPLIVTAIVSAATVVSLRITGVTGAHIMSWLSLAILFNLLFFLTSAATGIVTGMTTIQGLVSVILLILPTGLSKLVLHNTSMYTLGFAYDCYIGASDLSPILRMSELSAIPIRGFEIGAYIIICMLLYAAGLYLYHHRHTEQAGSAITFDSLRPLFKYGVTFCSMLLAGTIFYDMQNGSLIWTFFGYFIGSLLGYYLSETLLNKSLHVFSFPAIRNYGLYGLTVITCISLLYIDITGYERRLPATSDIKSIYLDYSYHRLMEKEHLSLQYSETGVYEQIEPPSPVYTQADDIKAILDLNRAIVINRTAEKSVHWNNPMSLIMGSVEPVCLVYNLKNGSRVCRQYTIQSTDYAAQLKPIYESSAYKSSRNAIMEVQASDVALMEVQTMEINKDFSIVDPKEIQQAVVALQSDIRDESYEEITSPQVAWSHIKILLSHNKTTDLEWRKSYRHFAQWLQQSGQYNNARILSDDVQYAVVAKQSGDSQKISNEFRRSPQQYVANMESANGLKISDPDKLEACLYAYSYPNNKQFYTVVFQLKNGNSFLGSFTENNAPDFIKANFSV